jgi:hypothetical protein
VTAVVSSASSVTVTRSWVLLGGGAQHADEHLPGIGPGPGVVAAPLLAADDRGAYGLLGQADPKGARMLVVFAFARPTPAIRSPAVSKLSRLLRLLNQSTEKTQAYGTAFAVSVLWLGDGLAWVCKVAFRPLTSYGVGGQ